MDVPPIVNTEVPVHAALTAPHPMPAAVQQATRHAVPQLDASSASPIPSSPVPRTGGGSSGDSRKPALPSAPPLPWMSSQAIAEILTNPPSSQVAMNRWARMSAERMRAASHDSRYRFFFLFSELCSLQASGFSRAPLT
jgi:hypothetical protein